MYVALYGPKGLVIFDHPYSGGSARVGRSEGRRHSVAALRGTACRLPALGGWSRASSAAGAQNVQFGVSPGPPGRRNRAGAPCALPGGGVRQAGVLRVRGVLMVPGAERASP